MAIIWMGYFATYIGKYIAVSNAFKVWFKIEKTSITWRVVWLAQPELKLKDWAVDGVNYITLQQIGLSIGGQSFASIAKKPPIFN